MEDGETTVEALKRIPIDIQETIKQCEEINEQTGEGLYMEEAGLIPWEGRGPQDAFGAYRYHVCGCCLSRTYEEIEAEIADCDDEYLKDKKRFVLQDAGPP